MEPQDFKPHKQYINSDIFKTDFPFQPLEMQCQVNKTVEKAWTKM